MRPRKTVPSILKGWVLVVVLAVLGCTRKESEPGSPKTDEAQPPFPAVTNAKKTKAVVYSAVSTVGNPNARKSAEVQGYGLLALARGARFHVESGNLMISSAVEDCDIQVSAVSGQTDYCVLKLEMECREPTSSKSKLGGRAVETVSATVDLTKVTEENLQKAVLAILDGDSQRAWSIFSVPISSDSQASTSPTGSDGSLQTKKSGVVSLRMELLGDHSPPRCQIDLKLEYDVN